VLKELKEWFKFYLFIWRKGGRELLLPCHRTNL